MIVTEETSRQFSKASSRALSRLSSGNILIDHLHQLKYYLNILLFWQFFKIKNFKELLNRLG